jgi:hypothetical protein
VFPLNEVVRRVVVVVVPALAPLGLLPRYPRGRLPLAEVALRPLDALPVLAAPVDALELIIRRRVWRRYSLRATS